MIFRSPYPPAAIPGLPLSDFVLGEAAARGAKPAFIDGLTGAVITYEELVAAARAAAAALAARGFRPGDVAAILAPNIPEYAVAFHGISRAGGVVTTLNPLYTAGEIAHQLADAGARMLFTTPALLDKAREAGAQARVPDIVVFGEAAGAEPFSNLLKDGSRAPVVDLDPERHLAALPYSSGTTGLAKGVELPHRSMVAAAVSLLGSEPISEHDRVLAVIPMFHIYGMLMMLAACPNRGATVVTMARFDLEGFLRLIETHRITRTYLVPPIVLALAQHPAVANHDLSSLKSIFCGAAPLSAETARLCADRLGCVVKQGYGMTEIVPTHICPADRAREKAASVGVPTPNVECRVVDPETGTDVPQGQTGEIWSRGPQRMKRYWRQPEATAAMIDSEGWVRTGDIGYVDEDGFFYVVDRMKELIKYKGFQVAPAELEAMLLTHPAVSDAAVIPRPDPEAGEVPKAFVVLKAHATPGELIEYVAARVAPHKKIRYIEAIEQIPKSPSGKILRRVLVDRERKAAGG